MFVFDAGYDPIAIGAALTDTAAQVTGPHPRRPSLLHRSQPSQRRRARKATPPAPGSRCPTQQARPCPLPNCPSRTNATAECT